MTRGPLKQSVGPKVTERDFQRAVIELAQIHGWLVAHFRPAETAKGWRTPVQADGAGFPDLVLAGHRRVVYRELKSDTGRLSAEQEAWIRRLMACGADVDVWTPKDWPQIEKELAT